MRWLERRAYSVVACSAAWRAASARSRALSARACAVLAMSGRASVRSFVSGCMVGSRFVTGFSGGGRKGDLRPYARAGVAVDAPAAGQGLDDLKAEAAAVLQIRRPSRDRSRGAVVLDLQAHDVGAD